MTTRMQHYVWRKYIEGWQQSSGQVCCLRNGTEFQSNPANIMKKRDYYSLARITKTDIAFLDAMFMRTHPELRKLHEDLIELLGKIAYANHAVQASNKATEEERKYTNALVIETEEKLQSGIEQRALHILQQLRHEKVDFLSNYDLAMNFFQYISHQYMRTRAVREAIGEELRNSLFGRDFGHLKNLLCHCAGENLGASLFVDRNKFEIVFLQCKSSDEFITGDQPIVNVFRSRGQNIPPTELALYYPLGPSLSMILLPIAVELNSMEVPSNFVDELNNLIAQKAKEFLVARRMETLRRVGQGSDVGTQKDGQAFLNRMKKISMCRTPSPRARMR